jgi:hypothetical protein
VRIRRVFGLRLDRDIPIARLRQAFFEIARRRGRVRGIVSRHDEGGNGGAHQLLGLRAGRGVTVEQSVAHSPANCDVPLQILARISGGKSRVVFDH